MKSGVYIIRNRINGKVYVGQAADIRRRWREHISRLRSGRHQNYILQRSWNKHGPDAFEFFTAENCVVELLTQTEQKFIDLYQSHIKERGYNLSPSADSARGVKWTPEQRAKASAWQRGRKLTAEHRANVGKAGIGRKKSPETLAKMSAAMKGRPKPPEMRAKIAASLRGRHLSETCKAKISAAFKGRKFSESTREKFSAWQRGRKLSEETRAKISATKRSRNHQHTPEWKAKQSERMRAGHAQRMVEARLKKTPACGVAVQ